MARYQDRSTERQTLFGNRFNPPTAHGRRQTFVIVIRLRGIVHRWWD